MWIYTVEDFIYQCQQSSSHAYKLFKKLLDELDNLDTRNKAYQFLLQLKQTTIQNSDKRQFENCNFQFLQQNVLDANDQAMTLDLLQFPSTFLPEAWSFTFYEGLIRYPANEYNNKKVIELGCGIGWISIALALRYKPEYICGLDINPKAISCARLNLYLNALDENGETKVVYNNKSLLDIVTFHESNLFSHFDDQNVMVDRVIGCIPQVLNPESEVMENLIAETASDEYLHSLSNYFAKQGFIEDQFGLGLIASAVEKSIPILESNGKLILNLGGRPGRKVLERLMQRRGFKVRRIWQTQVEQAADTEIDALVDIEKSTGHRFEFYMSPNSYSPIDARTAMNFAQSGGKIFHSVDVYEAKMLFPEQVKTIYASVDNIADEGLRSAIDLTYDNYSDAEERYSFLAFLAKQIQYTSHLAYEETAGLNYFRVQLSEYFRYYLHVDVQEQQIVITPSRKELIEALLSNYQPKLTLVAKSLAHFIAKDFDNDKTQILQTPSSVELIVRLVKKLKPQLIITHLDKYELQSTQLVEQLIQCAIQTDALLVLDLTDAIDLSSDPDIHGIYRYLSDKNLPDNLIMIAGLVNNHVYHNFSLNITISSNKSIIKHLIDSAELTYSRTPVLKQFYYAHLLEQLLYFQRTRTTDTSIVHQQNTKTSTSLSLCSHAKKAFMHPAILGNHLTFNDETVRLDYGENELPVPEVLKQTLFESYLVRKCVERETSAQTALQALLSQRFNFPATYDDTSLIFANGVAPIYSALLNICKRANQTLLIPSGSYGYFVAAAQYKGLNVEIINTDEKDFFKLTAEHLLQVLKQQGPCWLFLNAPIVNPTGVIYSDSELFELFTIAAEYNTTIIFDSIFSGLEYEAMQKYDFHSADAAIVLLGGVSKEYSAGGLRFAYACSNDKILATTLSTEINQLPHTTVNYAIRKLVELQLQKETSLMQHLQHQKKLLSKRATILTGILRDKGWKVIAPSGGLFLVAKPQKFIQESGLSATEAGDKITKELFKNKNVVINNSTWTGLPGYCRFVLSCSQQSFDLAIERLKVFNI